LDRVAEEVEAPVSRLERTRIDDERSERPSRSTWISRTRVDVLGASRK
jgi:hypothetical protein